MKFRYFCTRICIPRRRGREAIQIVMKRSSERTGFKPNKNSKVIVQCVNCTTEFDSVKTLMEHEQTRHQLTYTYEAPNGLMYKCHRFAAKALVRCCDCSKEYETWQSMVQHIQNEHVQCVENTGTDTTTFDTVERVIEHERDLNIRTQKKLSCCHCTKTFVISKRLHEHEKDRHVMQYIYKAPENGVSYKCTRSSPNAFVHCGNCMREYETWKAMVRHIRSDHVEKQLCMKENEMDNEYATLMKIDCPHDTVQSSEQRTAIDILGWERDFPISERIRYAEYCNKATESEMTVFEPCQMALKEWMKNSCKLSDEIKKMLGNDNSKYGYTGVETDTLKEYGRVLFKLVVFLIRCVANGETKFGDMQDALRTQLEDVEGMTMDSIHELLYTLVTNDIDPETKPETLPIYWFVMLCNSEPDCLAFKNANAISKSFSALLYVFRSCLGYSISRGQTMKALETYMKSTGTNIISTVRTWACNIRGVEEEKASVNMCRIDRSTISINGLKISLEDLVNFVGKLLEECSQITKDLFRLCAVEIPILPIGEDCPQNEEVGFGIQSSLESQYGSILLHLGSDKYAAFEDLAYRQLEVIFVLMHLLCGMPGRGSEYPELHFRNNGHVRRSMFLHGDKKIMIQNHYNKGRIKSKKAVRVCRFVPPILVNYVLLAVVCVRPALIRCILKQRTYEAVEAHKTRLFVKRTGKWSRYDAPQVFQKFCRVYLQKSLQLGLYRHVALYFGYEHVLFRTVSPFNVWSLQSGHTTQTCRENYARTDADSWYSRIDEIWQFEQVSDQWSKLLLSSPTEVSVLDVVAESEERNCPIRRIDMVHHVHHYESGVQKVSSTHHPYIPKAQTMKNCRREMKKLMGTEYEFKSDDQAIAMCAHMENASNTLTVLETGGGKTLVYAVPALSDGKQVTIVVVPLVSIMNEYKFIEGYANYYSIWPNEMCVEKIRIVLVTSGYLRNSKFRDFVNNLVGKQKVRSFVIDEAHMILSEATYRVDFQDYSWLTSLGVNLHLLSGSVPSGTFESSLIERLSLNDIAITRGTTFRRDLKWEVVFPPKGCNVELNKRLAKKEGPTIVFYRSVEEVQRLAKTRATIVPYHSSMPENEKAENLRRFQSGEVEVLACTTACSAGVDFENVRRVIHMGIPYSLLGFIQAGGRCGRDGKGGSVSLIFDGKMTENVDVNVKRFIGEKDCRSFYLSMYLDGRGITCSESNKCNSSNCSITSG